MVQINGVYELIKNENLVEHFLALGLPEEKAKETDSSKPKVTVTIDGSKVIINSDSDIENIKTVWTLDAEVDEELPFGHVVKSSTTLNGDTLTNKFKTADGAMQGTRSFKFSDDGMVLTCIGSSDKIPIAKRYFKRV